MPTARELLEQADALMRRNRASFDDADIPELTDVVPESGFEKFDEAAMGASSITGEPPDSLLVVAPVVHGDDASLAQSEHDPDAKRWAALAEEVRMQVLQRIDIFTDTGLKQQLVERLQPVVDRASAELVGTVSQQVGELLRTYVAEAIEREIEKWRQGGH